MQTFLPLPDFRASARCLDPSRLGNQVYREALTLIRGGWANHPASRMWRGYTTALAHYALACLDELEERGKPYPHHRKTFQDYCRNPLVLPPWLGREDFHASHRAALLSKDFPWYSRFGWRESPATPNAKGSLPYVWPTVDEDPTPIPSLPPRKLLVGGTYSRR